MAKGVAGPILMGFEQELVLCATSCSNAEVDNEMLISRALEIAAGTLPHLRGSCESGIFITSGARIYIDCNKIEYASAECSSPAEMVRYAAAAERIAAKIGDQLCRQFSLADAAFYRCQVSYGTDATWGHHESFLTRTEPSALSKDVIPWLVARCVTAGAGGFVPLTDAGCAFTLSTRAAHMGSAVSASSTTPRERGIFHLKDQPMAAGGYHRLHCLVGESLCSHVGEYLRAGSTAIVVAMADAGLCPGREVQLHNPVLALKRFAADPTCKAQAPVRGGRMMGAVDIQRHYAKLARAHVSAAWMPPWAPEVLDIWDDMLDHLDGAPDSVADRLDWGIKYCAYASRIAAKGFTWQSLRHWSALAELVYRCWRLANPQAEEGARMTCEDVLDAAGPVSGIAKELAPHMAARQMTWDRFDDYLQLRRELFAIDFQFGRCGERGIFNKLDAQGVLDHHIAGAGEKEIVRAISEPPAFNRSRLRGEAIKRLHGWGSRYRAHWDSVIDSARSVILDLKDPFATEEHWSAAPSQNLAMNPF